MKMSACIRVQRDSWIGWDGSEAWGRYIDALGPWAWFATFTFKRDVPPDAAVRLYDKWHGRLSEALRTSGHLHDASRRTRAHVRAVLAIEWTTQGRVHLHAVLRAPGLGDLRRQRWRHRWEGLDSACGMARIHDALSGKASRYLGKYCGKGGSLVLRGDFRDRALTLSHWGSDAARRLRRNQEALAVSPDVPRVSDGQGESLHGESQAPHRPSG